MPVPDPFGLASGLPELVWDPVAGFDRGGAACESVYRRHGHRCGGAGHGDDAARFYAAEAAKVLQAFFHAAALTGHTLDHALRWVANPAVAAEPTEILREHPHAALYWHPVGGTLSVVHRSIGDFVRYARIRSAYGSPVSGSSSASTCAARSSGNAAWWAVGLRACRG